MRVPKSNLPNARLSRRSIEVDVAHLLPTGSTGQSSSASSNSPVVQSLEERKALFHLFLTEVGFVHCGEGDCAFVASIKVGVGWEEELIAQV